jgi:histidyl-tRNA synthetase
MALESVEQVAGVDGADEDVRNAVTNLKGVFAALKLMGVSDYCVFDPGIVRGLAYYTGVVFEIHDNVGELRAICGGGRYDNLLRDFGGPAIPATGMGMGDCVLEILLHEKGLLDSQVPRKHLEYFVAFADPRYAPVMYETTAQIRSKGHSAGFSYKQGGLSKQLREAASQKAHKCIIIGAEYDENRQLVVKDMASGEQTPVGLEQFFADLDSD